MSRKSSLSLAAALGLTALAATAFAQHSQNDQRPARLAPGFRRSRRPALGGRRPRRLHVHGPGPSGRHRRGSTSVDRGRPVGAPIRAGRNG